MLAYSALLAPLSVAPYLLGFAGSCSWHICLPCWAAVSVVHLQGLANAWNDEKLTAEKKLFGYSIFYLFRSVCVLMIDAIAFRVTGAYLLGAVMDRRRQMGPRAVC